MKKIIVFTLSLVMTTMFTLPLIVKAYDTTGGSSTGSSTGVDVNSLWGDTGIQTSENVKPEKTMTTLTRWAFIIFAGIFLVAILIGGAMYSIFPEGNNLKAAGMKMIQGAIVAAALALAAGLLWGIFSTFYNSAGS